MTMRKNGVNKNLWLERLLRRTAQVSASETLEGGWSFGSAELDGLRLPCYAQGTGALPVAAYGLRADGSPVLVCSEGRTIKPEIQAAAGFRERSTVWACQYEHSCGALLFTGSGDRRRWLVIEGTGGHIGFPKGHIEQGEDIAATVRRELREEVHVTNFRYIDSYRVDAQVITRKNREKAVTYFLASFDPAENILRKQEKEIVNLWLLPYEEARSRVNTALDRELIDKAQRLLEALK